MTDERGPAAYADDTPSLEDLTQHLAAPIEELGDVELLCGIPCYNSADTVANVVRAAEAGLRRHYPDTPAGIVILDSGSTDGTVARSLAASTAGDEGRLLIPADAPLPSRACTTIEGIRGKGSALRPLFTIARAVDASAATTFDSDLRSITPEWIEYLLAPVLEHGYDHVTPMYLRHKHDGTITNAIAYPLTASLYGTSVRQPIGGDFGFSGRLASHWAAHDDVWTTEVARFGIDVWMTTSAIVDGFRVAQARLGSKVHAPKDPGEHLGPMFRQVVGTMFTLAGRYQEAWNGADAIERSPIFGFPSVTGTDPLAIDVPGLLARFRAGVAKHDRLLMDILASETYGAVTTIARSGDDGGFTFPLELWIDVVQDLLVAGNRPEADHDIVLDAMLPLYFARTASFVREAADDGPEEAEARIGSFPAAFLARKDRLRERWRSQEPAPTS